MVELHRDGDLWRLDIGETENRFSPEWIDQVNRLLDRFEACEGPAALVTTARGKFFSNGLDLAWVQDNPEQFDDYVGRMQALLARFLLLPVPTVAAINGHAFGGGAMLALAHDQRVMREGRGFMCFPEADIGIPFTAGMTALIRSKVSPPTAITAMTTARRYTAEEAVHVGLVDCSAGEEELLPRALALAGDLVGKERTTLGAIKAGIFTDVVEALLRARAQ